MQIFKKIKETIEFFTFIPPASRRPLDCLDNNPFTDEINRLYNNHREPIEITEARIKLQYHKEKLKLAEEMIQLKKQEENLKREYKELFKN